ncbi:mucin-5B [Tenrec ecaudatus]|uniref:mucin-5B n=1 Tax=Tenrec ecaudatus TaxID=94439 RepID=UPI003F596C18
MGTSSWCWALACTLVGLLATQQAEQTPARHVAFIPPITVHPHVTPLNPAHNGRICSTWGDFHYKTFDGDIFRFPGLCNYVLASHCRAPYEDFNVQLRRELSGDRPVISHVVLKVEGLVLEVLQGLVLVNGQQVKVPHSRSGLLVEDSSSYIKISIRMVLTLFWGRGNSVLLELEPKYANQTCGMCGDFNGLPAFNEFYSHNTKLSPLQFGNLQKMDGPTEQCQDPLPSLSSNCTDTGNICYRILLGPAFSQCNQLVDPSPYIEACNQDLCRCPSCPCATITEYSRQCAHAGGQPQNWRSPSFCPQTCPKGMEHHECGSPCTNTCSIPEHTQLCDDHCEDGCFCPPGTVLDDVTHTGCVPLKQCPCTYHGRTYTPGATFNTSCSYCTCSGGRWHCDELPCPGTCSVLGGAHITTYDEKLYDLHGDCSYILSKRCEDNTFTVLAELRQCGLTETESCLKSVTLNLHGGDTVIQIQANGAVYMNSIYTQLPVSAANVTIFKPSSFFLLLQTGLGLQLQVQLVPLLQVYIRVDPAHSGQICGLCGNFNQNQADDFMALSGVVEGTGVAFANTWKSQAACPNVKSTFEDPCSLSVENEKYALHWCGLLTDPKGPFSPCHSSVNPGTFHTTCMFDTCSCERSEDCLCSALSAYVRACAAKGVLLSGWRESVCAKYMSNCPKSQSYTYVVDTCQPTCRSLSEADITCGISFVPMDGCTCPVGTYLDDTGNCVSSWECPCYLHGTVVAPGEAVHENGVVCSCSNGKLNCLGTPLLNSTGCMAPMLYLDCSKVPEGTIGAECLRSCRSLDLDCYSTRCVSGCVCPPGLVSDGRAGCVAPEDCPCMHNEAIYQPGDSVRVNCNTCMCRKGRWVCTTQPCLGTCVAYGDGHFVTFDGERYSFEGTCEYTLAQDYCGDSTTTTGTFRIVTENIPCGTTGVTCSKAIKIFLGSQELVLSKGHLQVVDRATSGNLPYKVRHMGLYLVIEVRNKLLVSWDRKTSVFIKLHPDYKGKVCGLCGNFDGNAINDFTTRSQSVVGDVLEFGNSWKFSPTCPDALAPRDPCIANPYRKAWAQKQCSILHSATFAACHAHVEPTKYYEACVSDACACDSGGDCECFCTAVAAYAQACHDAGVCVSWRSPEVCPLFCDYYNPHGECTWHYHPCGAPCMRTCRNPSGRCLLDMPGLEGCYPKCPLNKPFFSEDQMKCVAQCGCYLDDDYYEIGERMPAGNCQSCTCTPGGGIQCAHSLEDCMCTYEDRIYHYQEVIYNTTDGLGACLMAICGDNGIIQRVTMQCPFVQSTTPFTFSTTAAQPSTTSESHGEITTGCVHQVCTWSQWYDGSQPESGMEGGDFESFAVLRERGYQVCLQPVDIECRAVHSPNMTLDKLGQHVACDLTHGLTCLNREQNPPLCHNYELRVQCCVLVPCGSSTSLPTPGTPTTTTPQVPSIMETTLQSTPKITSAQTSQTQSTSCQPRCRWSEWFDKDYPKSDKSDGDVETFDKIRSDGGDICEEPQDIECQAENFPNWTLAQVGQNVHCNASFGLVCRNDEQEGVFHMCYNYRIRVLCCSLSHCATTTMQTTAGTSPVPTAAPRATTKPTLPPTVGTSPGPPSTTAATTTQGKTYCQPKCEWTDWYDTDFPTSGVSGGDMETFDNIRAAGGKICDLPQKIECRAENYPGVSLDQIGQVLNCSLQVGLVCRNSDQQGPFNMCFNYNVRVLCCDDYRHCGTTARPEPTPAATTPRTGTAGTQTTPVPPTTKLTSSPGTPPQTSTPLTTSPGQTSFLPPSPGTTPSATTSCEPRCTWTDWFDESYPVPGLSGGDFETYDNLRASGHALCSSPVDIECRSELFPDVPLSNLDQVVQCNVTFGLICRNREQFGTPKYCNNFHIRVLCCEDRSHCPSTPATTEMTPTSVGETTTRSTVVPTPKATTTQTMPVPTRTGVTSSPGTPSQTPTSLTTSPGQTSFLPPSPGTTPSATTSCEPRCTWTDWFDESYPVPGLSGGDFETYDNLRASGHALCSSPVDIECRSELFPDVPLSNLDQVVQCNVTFGLICRNREQFGTPKYCNNFHIRVLCCEDRSHCPSTPATTEMTPTSVGETTTRSTVVPTPKATTTQTMPVPTRTGVTSSPGTPSQTPTSLTTSPGQTSFLPPSPGTTPSATTSCEPRCTWTDWFDESYPVPGLSGGDFETYDNLRASGHALCSSPVDIECRSELFPDVPLSNLDQVVQCNVTFGLICRNREQFGTPKYCSNFHIRVLCCEDRSHCPSTPATTEMTPTSVGETTTRSTVVPTPKATTTQTMPVPTRTGVTSSPGTPSQTPTSLTTSPGQTSFLPPSPGTTPSATTSCEPRCTWTDWFDESYPVPGLSGGDFETYDNLRASGHALCSSPVDIECRSELFPDVPLSNLDQVVQCNVTFGLICRNREQFGTPKYCSNFHIRVLCCEDRSHCPSTPATTEMTPTSVGETTTRSTVVPTPKATTTQTMPVPTRTGVTSSPGTPSQTSTPGATSTRTTRARPTSSVHGSTGSSTAPGTSTTFYPTECQPACHWSGWLDSDQPKPGPYGGDIETYYHIMDAGGQVCPQPMAIECEAVLSPGVPLESLGQKVHCRVEYGLICRNHKQTAGQTCLNYHVRVLCCDDYSHCGSTAVPMPTTTATATPAATPTPRAITSTATTITPRGRYTTSTTTAVVTPAATPTPRAITTTAATITPRGKYTTSTTTVTATPAAPPTPKAITSTATTITPPGRYTTSTTKATATPAATPTPRATSTTAATGTTEATSTPRATSTTEAPRTTAQTPTTPTAQGLRSSGVPGPSASATTQTHPTIPTPNESFTSSTPSQSTPGGTTTTMASTAPQSTTPLGTSSAQTSILPPSPGTTPSATTSCEPRCTWTDWFDESYPVPGLSGGDFETYDNLRASGHALCSSPVDIECRSELFPDVPLSNLDQVVQCNVTFGLICRNREQFGTPKYCSNFHIRVLCCEDRSHCPSTPGTTEMTPTSVGETTTRSMVVPTSKAATTQTMPVSTRTGVTSSPGTLPQTSTPGATSTRTMPVPPTTRATTQTMPVPPTTRATSIMETSTIPLPSLSSTSSLVYSTSLSTSLGPTSTSPVPTSGTPTSSTSWTSTGHCYCHAFGKLFQPGDIVYNKTDKAGCPFYAVCNQQCDIDRFQGACPTTVPSTSPEATPPGTPTTTPPVSPSLPVGCDHVVPPRQVNETWTLEDCTIAMCEGNNRIVLLKPKPVANVTCANQYPPIKVQNKDDHCDYHYECPCICTGWGETYSTFDGTTFSFRDNCTYLLLREISPTFGNLTILLDHQHCAATTDLGAGASGCHPALLLHYLSMQVVLTVTGSGEKLQSLVLFNSEKVGHGFSKKGVAISETVTGTMGVDIPALGVHVTFDGSIVQVQLSYAHFHHNTEGQCGTCTNSQVDDCRLPDGTIAPTCDDMAWSWLVPDSSKEGCLTPTTPPIVMPTAPTTPRTGTSTPCTSPSLCQLILSPIFSECHDLVPPTPFFEICTTESCGERGSHMPCQSLEAYAALCRLRGACSNWRNATGGLCDFSCPPTKVYDPCGPVLSETCNYRNQGPLIPGRAEGCFCPHGQILFNEYMDICVEECREYPGHVSHGAMPGEEWISNCQACECQGSPPVVRCRPVQCEPPEEPSTCGYDGFQRIIRPRADNPCCQEILCFCNMTTCSQKPPVCELGQKLVQTEEEGDCCATFTCEPETCVYKGIQYGINAVFRGDVPCHTCTCLAVDAQLAPIVDCRQDTCNTTCPLGSEYRERPDKCCGECVQTHCLLPNGQLLQPSDTWISSSADNCTKYRCFQENLSFLLVPEFVQCPNVSYCKRPKVTFQGKPAPATAPASLTEPPLLALQGVLRKVGCCFTCEEESDRCHVRVNATTLRFRDCESESTVGYTYCEGVCQGMSKYLMGAQVMDRHCACCQETKTHMEEVTLRCANGTRVTHSYLHVDQCGCGPACLLQASSKEHVLAEDYPDTDNPGLA